MAAEEPAEGPEPDIYYADDSYTSKGPVTEDEFFAAWKAKKVHGWPDRALVWWTDLDGGWVPLDGATARKRFGTRFTTNAAPHSRKDESDAGPAPKRLKEDKAQTTRPGTSGVIDLSEDSAHDVVVSAGQPRRSKLRVASTQCIDLAGGDDDDEKGSPPQPGINRARDPRLRREDTEEPSERERVQQTPTHSSGSGWSGSPDTSPVQQSDPDRNQQLSLRTTPAKNEPPRSASSTSSGPLWSRQCKVNRIAPEMVPSTWKLHDDPPKELVDWLRKLLERAGEILEVADLRQDRVGQRYSCKLTMGTKKAMLNAISLSNLPDRCPAVGKSNGFLHICNIPRSEVVGGGQSYRDARGDSGDWSSGCGGAPGGTGYGSFHTGMDRNRGPDDLSRQDGYMNGHQTYDNGCYSGWGGGGGFSEPPTSQLRRPSGSGWGGGGHGGVSNSSAAPTGAGWAGPAGRGAGAVVPAWAAAGTSGPGNLCGPGATSAGWGSSLQSQQNCTRCGGTGIFGCPHQRNCDEVRRCIAAGTVMCFVCGGDGHDMTRCPLSSSPTRYG